MILKVNRSISDFIKKSQIATAIVFLWIVLLLDIYTFVYNKLFIQNIAGPILGSPLALSGEILIVCIFVSISLIFPKRVQRVYLTLLLGLLSLIYLSVLVYFREFKYFPTVNLLGLVFHEGNVLGDVTDVIISLLRPSDLVILILFFGWLVFLTFFKGAEISARVRIKTGLICLFSACFLFSFYKISFNLIYQRFSPWHQELRPNPDLIISHIGFLPFCVEQGYSLYKSSHEPKIELTDKDKDFLLAYYKANKPSTNEYTGLFKGYNLFLIQFESLNNLIINRKINDHEISPNLDRLIQEGVYFPQYYTQEGAGPTTSSEFVTLNSIIAPIDVFIGIGYRQNTYHTMASLFSEKGYYTFAIHGNFGSYYNREGMYKKYGFSEFYDRRKINNHVIHKWTADEDMLSKAADIAIKGEKPFFGFPITVTSHKNWDLTPELDMDTGNHHFIERAEGYVKNIHYSDKAIGLFLEKLKKAGLLDRTIVIIYGDHSAKLKKDEIESILNMDLTEKEFTRIKLQIPLIIWTPNGELAPRVIQDIFPQINLLPTIANLFDLGKHYGIGRDFFDQKSMEMACTNEYTITNDNISSKSDLSKEEINSSPMMDNSVLMDEKGGCLMLFKLSELILKTDAIKFLKTAEY